MRKLKVCRKQKDKNLSCLEVDAHPSANTYLIFYSLKGALIEK